MTSNVYSPMIGVPLSKFKGFGEIGHKKKLVYLLVHIHPSGQLRIGRGFYVGMTEDGMDRINKHPSEDSCAGKYIHKVGVKNVTPVCIYYPVPPVDNASPMLRLVEAFYIDKFYDNLVNEQKPLLTAFDRQKALGYLRRFWAQRGLQGY